jgi:hypothetical protein
MMVKHSAIAEISIHPAEKYYLFWKAAAQSEEMAV